MRGFNAAAVVIREAAGNAGIVVTVGGRGKKICGRRFEEGFDFNQEN
jgi:hypothetical protein